MTALEWDNILPADFHNAAESGALYSGKMTDWVSIKL